MASSRLTPSGDDVELYTDDSRTRVLTTFHFLRQQMEKPEDQFNHCLADFVAPEGARHRTVNSPTPRLSGGLCRQAGFGVEELCRKFERDHDDYNSIMTKALADRLAEAFAELLHQRARRNGATARTRT